MSLFVFKKKDNSSDEIKIKHRLLELTAQDIKFNSTKRETSSKTKVPLERKAHSSPYRNTLPLKPKVSPPMTFSKTTNLILS